jgi:hypothetical protein
MAPTASAAARRAAGAHPRRAAAGRAGPRRVSGPARGARPGSGGAIAAPRPLAFRIADVVHALTENRVADRLVRGRAWIAIVGLGLMGIVFLQVSMLRMNTGIGRDVEHAAALQRENAALQTTISRLSAGERIQTLAGRLGMVQQATATTHYLSARSLRISRAVRGITEPSTTPPIGDSGVGIGTLAAVDVSAASTSAITSAATTTTTTTAAPATTEQPAATTAAGAQTATATAGTTAATTAPAGAATTPQDGATAAQGTATTPADATTQSSATAAATTPSADATPPATQAATVGGGAAATVGSQP